MVILSFCLILKVSETQFVIKVHLKALHLKCLCPVSEYGLVTWEPETCSSCKASELMCQIIPSYSANTWNEETCILIRLVPMALVDVSKCGTNGTLCTNTRSYTIISVTSQLNHFFSLFKQSKQKHSGLRYHTSTLHCWTWPQSPRRRISNFPDPASPLVQCWHAAGSQLLLEAVCESQQRQTHPTSPLSPTSTPLRHWYFLCAS